MSYVLVVMSMVTLLGGLSTIFSSGDTGSGSGSDTDSSTSSSMDAHQGPLFTTFIYLETVSE